MYILLSVYLHIIDLLVSLPTDDVSQGEIKYGNTTAQPLHDVVRVQWRKKGFRVTSPAGQAIGCSESKPCDITWVVDLQNSTCPCVFNNTCCRDGVSFSFWWRWNDAVVAWYRYLLDLGGIYIFYNANDSPKLKHRFYGGTDSEQWYGKSTVPYNTWNQLTFTMKSSQVITYLNGRCIGKGESRILSLGWYPELSVLHPRFWLKQIDGDYSFGNLQVWEGKKSAAFLWRQYYEKILLASEP